MNKIITHIDMNMVRTIKQQIAEADIKFLTNDLFVAIVGLKEIVDVIDSLHQKDKEKIVVISITEPGTLPLSTLHVDILKGFSDALEIQFWDVVAAYDNYTVILDEQASLIRAFIEKNIDKKFLIHCKAGISRSAGVASAVECLVHFNGDANEYSLTRPLEGFWRYIPNKAVFDSIINS